MTNGIEKFDMFADMVQEENDFTLLEDGEVGELVSVTLKADSKKKFSTVRARTQEEFDEYVESVHYETMYRPGTGEPYQVKVTVLKPEANPLEFLRPAYAYSTNH